MESANSSEVCNELPNRLHHVTLPKAAIFIVAEVTTSNLYQDRQCTYNVALRRVHEAIFAVEKQYVLNISVYGCVCVARMGACVCVGVGVDARALACACVSLALQIQNAKRRLIVIHIHDLCGSTTFVGIIS
jgi:hypothetical protein